MPTKKPPRLERVARSLNQNPAAKALAELTPVGSAFSAAIDTELRNVEASRRTAFFDELSAGGVRLTPELVRSEDFLHCYFATARAALRSRRRQKTRLFARLLRAAVETPTLLSSIDEYEEYLLILDELSYREIGLLALIERFELANPPLRDENAAQRTGRYWPALTRAVAAASQVPEGQVEPLLVRLGRSGLYSPISGTFWDYEGGRGLLTPLYYRLKGFVQQWGNDAQ